MKLSNRIALITGAGSGIGAVMARRFAAEGATVVVLDISESAAADTASGIAGAVSIVADVTDREMVRAAVARVGTELGAIDVLVNNAAVCCDTPFEDLTDAEWSRDLAVSLTGAFLMSQAVLPTMLSRHAGVMLNVASVNASAYFGNEGYSAAKAGLLSLTRSIAVRYGPAGIRCNALVPGTITTPVWNDRIAADPDVLDRAARWYPLGRIGAPDDVAAAALFLVSDEANWITGVTLPVDGGLLAGNRLMADEIVPAWNSGLQLGGSDYAAGRAS